MSRLVKYEASIQQVLLRYPNTRDDDTLLFEGLLADFFDVNSTLLSFHSLMDGIREQKYPSFDSVTRLRRKIQDEHPDTRGDLWFERRGLEKEYQQELGFAVTK